MKKIYIYTNNLDDKYSWLKNKFKNDVYIFINEIKNADDGNHSVFESF